MYVIHIYIYKHTHTLIYIYIYIYIYIIHILINGISYVQEFDFITQKPMSKLDVYISNYMSINSKQIN